MERNGIVVLLGLAALGVLVLMLSFLPWVEFEGPDLVTGDTFAFTVPGTELSRLRGPDYYQPADIADQDVDVCTCRTNVGDGYLTAALGAIMVGGVVTAFLLGNRMAPAVFTAIAAGLIGFAVAGYNAAGEWQAIGAPMQDDPFVEMTGTVQLAPYLIAVAGAAAAVLGAVLLWLNLRGEIAEDEADQDEPDEHFGETYLSWA